MKRGSVLMLLFWILFFSILGLGAYYIWNNYRKVPNALTIQTAQSIPKYPNSSSWKVESNRNLCFQLSGCTQPVNINFETADNWGNIYTYYGKYLQSDRWTTNKTIVTGIPNNIVYNKGSCKLVMENHTEVTYTISVTCEETQT